MAGENNTEIYLEIPYDQGSPWQLRKGYTSAVVSAETARVLNTLGIQILYGEVSP